MKIYRSILIIFCLGLILCASLSNAALNVSPSTAAVGQTVTATLSGTLPRHLVEMSLRINFGDGSPTAFSPRYTTAGTYSFTVTHSYTRPGTYAITGQTFLIGPALPLVPITERRTVAIVNATGVTPGGAPLDGITDEIIDLPRGAVGDEYEHSLATTPESRSNRYRLTGSGFPPGLKLLGNGLITGTPTKKGEYTFTVRIFNRSGASISQEFALFVDPGKLTIRVTPEVIETTRGGGTRQQVTFTVISPTVKINETIRSSRGEFLAAGRVLGYVSRPMNINLNTLQPAASERIQIPNNVLRAAQSAGTSKIIYRRTFKSHNLEKGSGETRINMRTAASGQLRINKLRIFFEQNNRPLILVERNSRDLTGVIDIHYNGSGTFKGYWKVDKRIIQRVQKNMFYGKVLTLKTPNAPPLPTYSEGPHRLQFIITEPESAQQKIDFPEAIYHVEAKKAEIVMPISLTAPDNDVQLDASGETFSWSEVPRVTTYLIEFFDGDEEEPFFTAYSKEGAYTLPAKILSIKFIAGRSYSWHVRGFNSGNILTAESPDRSFMLLE